jgi:uncharacterized oxidoreductase
VLVNNAGIMRFEELDRKRDLRDAEETVATNLLGPIRITNALIDHLAGRENSAIVNVTSGLAFVPLVDTPTYCATKAAIHSYTQSLRFQFGDSGVEVIEIMPPAVKTEMTADLSDGDGFTLITTAELVKLSFASLKAGALEIHPGQSRQLAFMRRVAPNFINRQLWKASRKLVPVEAGQRG